MSKNFKKYFKKHLHFDEITLWLSNHSSLTTKCTTLENSGTSTIITPALLATPYPQGGAQTQKSPLGDLGVSYIVEHKGFNLFIISIIISHLPLCSL